MLPPQTNNTRILRHDPKEGCRAFSELNLVNVDVNNVVHIQ